MQKMTRCKKNRGRVGSMLMALAMVITLLTGIKTTSVEASQPAPVKQFADLQVGDVLSSGDVIQLPNHGDCTENSGKPFLVYEIKNGKGYSTTVSCNGTYTIPQSEGINVKYVVTKCVDDGRGSFPCGELDFELSTYAVTVQTDGNGTATADKATAAGGTVITLTATPNSGYQFKEWQVISGGITLNGNAFTMPGSNVTVKAVFEKIPVAAYAVTVQNDGNGTATASVASAEKGTAVTLTATPNSGYQFKEWQVLSGGVTVEDNAFTMPESDVTVKAVFEKIPVATYAVTVQNDGNGTATASVASAEKGTAVTLTATPNSGYQFKEWQVISGGITVEDNAFTMPGNEVTVKAIFEKTPGQGTVTGGTEQGNGAPATSLNNSAEDLKNKVLTAQENARVSAGENARVYLEVNDRSSTVSAADKTLIQEKLGRNVLGLYLDISLYKQIGTDAAQKVTAPNGKISISIKIPDHLINKDSSKIRTYQMVRVHDGAAAVIKGTYDAATKLFTFKTDAFSTYALVYQDTAEGSQNSTTTITTTTDNQAAAAPASVKDDVPKTGDVNTVAFWLFLVAVSGAGVLCFGKKKRAIEK